MVKPSLPMMSHEPNGKEIHWQFKCLINSSSSHRTPCTESNNKVDTKAPYYWPFVMGIHWSETRGFPSQKASNTVTVSKWWRHHESCFLRILTLGSMAPISCVMGSLSNTSTMQSPPGTGVYTISLGCRYPTRPRFTVRLPWYMISKVCGWTAGQANSRHKPNANNFIVMVDHPDGHSGDTWNKKENI